MKLNIAIEEVGIDSKRLLSTEFAKRENFKYISGIKTYSSYRLNNHHWTTEYVWNDFIPFLFNELKITEFSPDDFIKKENLSENKQFDLSYHIPKNDVEITYLNLTEKISKNIKISQLRLNENEEKGKIVGSSITNYHRLFAGWHKCSILQRTDDKYSRSLILNCDSMMIPVIPILINYYKNILVLDNRNHMSNKNVIEQFKKMNADYISCFIASNIVCRNPEQLNLN